jgi:hypothetical protein
MSSFAGQGPAESRPPPGPAGFVIGGVVIALGVAAAIAWAVLGVLHFKDAIDDLHRLPVPGAITVQLDKGRYTVYQEVSSGGSDAARGRVPPSVSVTPALGGPALALSAYEGSLNYDLGGHAGAAVAGFRVERSGRYRVATRAVSSDAADLTVAVGPGLGRRIVGIVAGAAAFFFPLVSLGGGLIIATAIRRRRRRVAPPGVHPL